MGQKEKLIARLRSHPRDFTFIEVERLLGYLGFARSNKGATSGSRVRFVSDERGVIDMHRPHPGSELKPYQVRQLLEVLERKGLI
jgi:hypothetical protein